MEEDSHYPHSQLENVELKKEVVALKLDLRQLRSEIDTLVSDIEKLKKSTKTSSDDRIISEYAKRHLRENVGWMSPPPSNEVYRALGLPPRRGD